MARSVDESLSKYGDIVLNMVEVAEVLGVSPEQARAYAARVVNPLPTFCLPTDRSRPQRRCWYSQLRKWTERLAATNRGCWK